VTEDFVGEPPPTLASMKGKPVVLFLWDKGCGDCKAQSASLARVLERWKGSDVRCVAITRYYDDPPARAREKARVDSVWTAVYAGVGPIPRVMSTASMIEYGGSSTPTFVFIDRRGIVRRYTPYRLTEADLDRSIDAIAR
jgi:cytochrome c biogenesis protein CcmG/thiol:disulfide interchange protein DsbE